MRGADGELAGVDYLEQVDVLAAAVEVGIEEGCAVVVEFLAREPVGPPVGLVVEGIEAGVGQELSACWNGVLGQQIFPTGAVDGQFYGHYIAYVDRALERSQVVGDGVGGFGLVLLENVVVAGDIEREFLLLVEFLVRRVPRTLRGPVGDAVATLANGDLAAAARLGSGDGDAPGR